MYGKTCDIGQDKSITWNLPISFKSKCFCMVVTDTGTRITDKVISSRLIKQNSLSISQVIFLQDTFDTKAGYFIAIGI